MSGFGKVTFVGEYFNQAVVNVLHYRAAGWVPGAGNPFDDVDAFVEAVVTEVQASLLAALPADYRLNTVEGVGYDDSYAIVTGSPIIKTVNTVGSLAGATNGAPSCCIIGLRCGEQVQINGTGKSLRNRGYVAAGPLRDDDVDSYQHIIPAQYARMETLAGHLDNQVAIVGGLVTLIPIRIHEKFQSILGHQVLLWRTYSDVLGYRVQRVSSYRRSRQAEA